jgi:hypothetical protein
MEGIKKGRAREYAMLAFMAQCRLILFRHAARADIYVMLHHKDKRAPPPGKDE